MSMFCFVGLFAIGVSTWVCKEARLVFDKLLSIGFYQVCQEFLHENAGKKRAKKRSEVLRSSECVLAGKRSAVKTKVSCQSNAKQKKCRTRSR